MCLGPGLPEGRHRGVCVCRLVPWALVQDVIRTVLVEVNGLEMKRKKINEDF